MHRVKSLFLWHPFFTAYIPSRGLRFGVYTFWQRGNVLNLALHNRVFEFQYSCQTFAAPCDMISIFPILYLPMQLKPLVHENQCTKTNAHQYNQTYASLSQAINPPSSQKLSAVMAMFSSAITEAFSV